MTNADELAERVLAELEEFGEENIFSMLNTIIDPAGSKSEIETFSEALRRLIEAELIIIGMEGFYPREPEELGSGMALELVGNLKDWFRYDGNRSCWTLKAGEIKSSRIPVIYRTETGLRRAENILEARGYQWWRRSQ